MKPNKGIKPISTVNPLQYQGNISGKDVYPSQLTTHPVDSALTWPKVALLILIIAGVLSLGSCSRGPMTIQIAASNTVSPFTTTPIFTDTNITVPKTATPNSTATGAIDSIIPTSAQPSFTPTYERTSNWRTYTNPKYGYQIKFPLNWFTSEDSNFESQSFYPSFENNVCGEGGRGQGVYISVLENPNNLSASNFFTKYVLTAPSWPRPPKMTSDRMGLAQNLDVVMSTGSGYNYINLQADINTGKGQIIEIQVLTYDFQVNTIFSTFTLTNANPNLKEFTVGIVDKNGGSPPNGGIGDIEVLYGDQKTIITDWGYNYSPVLSPDRTKIAYESTTKEEVAAGYDAGNASNSNNVWIINVDGSNPIQVTRYDPEILRDDIHWLDNERLMFSDGDISVKLYSLTTNKTQTVLGPEQPVPYLKQNYPDNVFLYNSDSSYLLRFPAYSPEPSNLRVAIIDLSTLKVTTVSDDIVPISCLLEFGPDNTTFLIPNDNSASELAIIDLKTGKVAYQ